MSENLFGHLCVFAFNLYQFLDRLQLFFLCLSKCCSVSLESGAHKFRIICKLVIFQHKYDDVFGMFECWAKISIWHGYGKLWPFFKFSSNSRPSFFPTKTTVFIIIYSNFISLKSFGSLRYIERNVSTRSPWLLFRLKTFNTFNLQQITMCFCTHMRSLQTNRQPKKSSTFAIKLKKNNQIPNGVS